MKDKKLKIAVDCFYTGMVGKLEEKEEAGFSGWDTPSFQHQCKLALLDHFITATQTGKSEDWIDVGNFAMFLFYLTGGTE